MIRQRINLRTPALALVVRALTGLLALVLIWYGAMVVLLAVKVSPHTVNSISGYHSLYKHLVGLREHDFTTTVRLIAGFSGLILFLLLLALVLQEIPRPSFARGDLELENLPRGNIVVAPRALERIAETAAEENGDVTAASGRLGNGRLNVLISVRRASTAVEALRDVRRRVRSELERHELPRLPVNVTVSAFDRRNRRELS